MENGDSKKIPAWLLEDGANQAGGQARSSKTHFLRRTLKNISGIVENELYCEKYAAKDNFLQIVDPRVKFCVFLIFIIFGSFGGSVAVLTVLAAVPIVYAGLSGIPVRIFFRRIWLIVPVMIFLVSLPGASNLFIRGHPMIYVLGPGCFGMKEGLYFSAAGLRTAFRLMLRAGISLSFSFLLLLTTRWSKIASGLETMHTPSIVTSILNMTYRYIFLLSETAREMMEARYLRTFGKLKSSDNRHFVAHSTAYLFLKGHCISEEIYEAMCCRGYAGISTGLFDSEIALKDYIFIFLNAVILFLLILGEHLK